MITLKNKILIKLIFIISILMIVVLNLFGEEKIEFKYYYYTNKIYNSTLKTEIIPSDYVFITTTSSNRREEYYDSFFMSEYYREYYDLYSYIYNLKTKEKKLLYVINFCNNVQYGYEYYDINGNLTTNWTDENMEANGFYEITNNRFGETFYNLKIDIDYRYSDIRISKENGYIQKAYKYSLTQPEIINKKDRGIYMFRFRYQNIDDASYNYFSLLCLQNEYYRDDYRFYENGLLNYDSKGRVVFNRPVGLQFHIKPSFSTQNIYSKYTNTIYFKLNDKSFIKPTWNEFNNNSSNFIKKYVKNDSYYYGYYSTNIYYREGDIETNLNEYKKSIDVDFLGFIPIEEFEYYLLAD